MAKNPTPSLLDPGQIIRRIFNNDSDSIRVDATVQATIGTVEVVMDAATGDSAKSWVNDGSGNPITSTPVAEKKGLDVNLIGGVVSGEFVASGLSSQGRIITFNVSDTATPLPAVALPGRNSLALTNLSSTDTLYVGFLSSITADRVNGLTSGWEIGPNEGFNLDIRHNIVLYGITEAGKTIQVKLMELA